MNVIPLILSQVDAGTVGDVVAQVLPALPATPADGDVLGWGTALYSAVMSKNWGSLLFLGVTLIVFLMRKFLGPTVPFINSKMGGAILTFFWAFAGMLATVWTAHITPSGADVWKALSAAFIASGGWSLLTNVIEHAATTWKWGWAMSVLVFLKPSKAPVP